MIRFVVPLVASFGLLPGSLFAQGFTRPLPTPPPVRVPGSSVLYPAASLFTPRAGMFGGYGRYGLGYGYGLGGYYGGLGYGLGYGLGWGGYGGYGWSPYSNYPGYYYSGLGLGMGTVMPAYGAPPLMGAGGSGAGTQATVNARFPAQLTIEFPASASVTVNGQPVSSSGPVQTLTSPALELGRTYTFNVKAHWSADGQEYEWNRNVTVAAGERSQVNVAHGFPVKASR
jgi:uncharacterized protein (TIGR03000 family)